MPTIIIKPRKSSMFNFPRRIEPLLEGKPAAVAVVACPETLANPDDLASQADLAKVVTQALRAHRVNPHDPCAKIRLRSHATFAHLDNLEELVHRAQKEMLVNQAPMAMLAKTVIQELKVLRVHPVHLAPLATMVLKAMLVLHQS